MSAEERVIELEAALQAEQSRRMCREADAKQYHTVIDTAIRVLMQHLYAMEPGGESPSDQGPGGMLAQCVESVLAQHREDRAALQSEREARERAERRLAEYSGWSPHQFTGLLEEHRRLQSAHVALDARRYAAEVLVADLREQLRSVASEALKSANEEASVQKSVADWENQVRVLALTCGWPGSHSSRRPWGYIQRAIEEVAQLRSERAEAAVALEPLGAWLDRRAEDDAGFSILAEPYEVGDGCLNLGHLRALHTRLTAGETAKEEKPPQIGCAGWIIGSNYRKRGRFLGDIGKSGEPWYETDDGTRWSAFDVEFRPDEAKEDKPDAA